MTTHNASSTNKRLDRPKDQHCDATALD